MLGLGSLALIRHGFGAALRTDRGRGAAAGIGPSVRGDRGRARRARAVWDAFAAYQRMVSLRPSLASYARIAYARELTGDRGGAAAAMPLALDAAGGQPEPTAWTHVELSKLELGIGSARAAGATDCAARDPVPGYPAARAELALVEAALGRPPTRSPRLGGLADAVPTPQAVALSGTCSTGPDRSAEAPRQRATVSVVERLLQANGVQVDLESAVNRADFRVRPAETVDLAGRARAERPSIYGDDALAWALARAGRCKEASLPRGVRSGSGKGSHPLLPPRVCGGMRGSSRGDARVVPGALEKRPRVLRPLGPRRARGPGRRSGGAMSADAPRPGLGRRDAAPRGGRFLAAHDAAYRLTGTWSEGLHTYLEHAPQVLSSFFRLRVRVRRPATLRVPSGTRLAGCIHARRVGDLRAPGAPRAPRPRRRGRRGSSSRPFSSSGSRCRCPPRSWSGL